MSNDPATLLRQSDQLELTAVLEIGHANGAAPVPLMLTDPVVIPVELEWTGGEAAGSPTRASTPTPVAATARPQPVGTAPVSMTPGSMTPGGMAPVAPRPSRRRGRFPVGN